MLPMSVAQEGGSKSRLSVVIRNIGTDGGWGNESRHYGIVEAKV